MATFVHSAVSLRRALLSSTNSIDRRYELARERYLEWGVDPARAVAQLSQIPLSLHCWQGDDVVGFERSGAELGGGLAVTGNYPGRATSAAELRADLAAALALLPGRHRVNLHAMYAETSGRRVERDELAVEHFQSWIDWARDLRLGLDFNPTFFAHPRAAGGLTLAHPDAATRQFWIRHGAATRRIAAAMGRALGSPCVNNVWIPDGSKDSPADRLAPRRRLLESLDALFSEPFPETELLDAVECKLFGLGSEAYVVGSHEFYLGYAQSRRKVLCLDAGHFHPTEVISDKLSAVFCFVDRVLLHVSRGVRWDSDHVVVWSDELRALAAELVRGDFLPRVHLGLDFFDASINRVAAWVIGARSLQKALLVALLEPTETLRDAERHGDLTCRLALQEELHSLPWGAIWDYFCVQAGVPPGEAWLDVVQTYERQQMQRRSSWPAPLEGPSS